MTAHEPAHNPLLSAALAYAAAGLEIFPVGATDKAPLTRNGMKDATTDPARLRAWWQRHPGALVACRVPVDTIILDIDPRHGGDTTWAALEADYGPIGPGRAHASGRGDGGRHVWLRRPAGQLSTRRLDELARELGVGQQLGGGRWTAGIDLLRHEHRYSILPPSPHPDTGRPYYWLDEQSGPADTPGWLAHLLTPPDRPVPPAAQPGTLRLADEDSIADWFSATTTWPEILSPAGWRIVAGDGDRDGSKWQHPAATAASSATIRYGCLFVYSSSTELDPTETGKPAGYTRFRAWATLEHGGDLSAAARAARERRDGAAGPDAARDLTGLIAPSGGPAAAVEWPPLIPLDATIPPPAFPLHVLPDWLRAQVEAVADNLQVAVDLPACLAFGALSVATLGRVTIHYPRSAWRQPANLFIAVSLPPSAGKSPAKNVMFAPLERWEQTRIDAAREQAVRSASQARILKKRLDDLESSAARTGDPQALSEAGKIAVQLATLDTAPTGRLMADDATVEALGMALAAAGGSLAVVSAEGGLFDRLAGLYSDTGTANLDLYLEAWGGGRYVVDRVKRDPIHIPAAHVAVVTTIQPTVLAEIGARKTFAGRGLTARFLLVEPPSNVGWRDRRRRAMPNVEAEQAYGDRMGSLARAVAAQPATLTVDGAAGDLFAEWDQALEVKCRPSGQFEHMAEWVGKMRANALRLAALLHLAEGGTLSGEIAVETMASALELIEYFLAHALRISERWGLDEPVAQAARIVEWADRAGLDRFTAREVMAANRRRFPRADTVEEPLRTLAERGWIRPEVGSALVAARRGAASPVLLLRPALMRAHERTDDEPHVSHARASGGADDGPHVSHVSHARAPGGSDGAPDEPHVSHARHARGVGGADDGPHARHARHARGVGGADEAHVPHVAHPLEGVLTNTLLYLSNPPPSPPDHAPPPRAHGAHETHVAFETSHAPPPRAHGAHGAHVASEASRPPVPVGADRSTDASAPSPIEASGTELVEAVSCSFCGAANHDCSQCEERP